MTLEIRPDAIRVECGRVAQLRAPEVRARWINRAGSRLSRWSSRSVAPGSPHVSAAVEPESLRAIVSNGRKVKVAAGA